MTCTELWQPMYCCSGILLVNSHAEVNQLNLNYIDSFVFYSSTNRLSNRLSFCPVANCYWYTDGHNVEGQSSHVLVFCVNFERHICTYIITSIKCFFFFFKSLYVPFTYILCQSNWHVYISTNFQNVNKPSTLHSYLQNKFQASKSSLMAYVL